MIKNMDIPTTKYWTEETEQAINQYNNSTDMIERNRIFEDKLYAPLL